MVKTILKIISALAIVEFILGSILIEGGSFGLGSLAMAMPLAFFTLILFKYGR
jgi:hypothetical protein